jgi:hypothetical protein
MGVNMTKISQLIAGACLSLGLAAVPAGANPLQTYVSGKGADTGGCDTPAKACRTFAFAIAQTAASGEIKAIDPANYGPVTITKSISIVADGGGPAGIFKPASVAINIESVGPPINVNLRGLTLDGAGTASLGIFDLIPGGSSGSVTITDCFIRNFTGGGIVLGGAGTLTFLISKTVASDSGDGLSVNTDGSIKGVVDHFTASGDNIGIFMGTFVLGNLGGASDVTIVDSIMANDTSDGLLVGAPNGSVGATVRLASSVVKGNGIGVNITAGKVFSYGDNEINGNGTDVKGTLTPLAKK